MLKTMVIEKNVHSPDNGQNTQSHQERSNMNTCSCESLYSWPGSSNFLILVHDYLYQKQHNIFLVAIQNYLLLRQIQCNYVSGELSA